MTAISGCHFQQTPIIYCLAFSISSDLAPILFKVYIGAKVNFKLAIFPLSEEESPSFSTVFFLLSSASLT
jgi:hypothetical protein